MIDVATLARLLHEEFERDFWGDIDPDLFGGVAIGEDGNCSACEGKGFIPENDCVEGGPVCPDCEGVRSLRDVLERVVARLEGASDGSEDQAGG